MGGPDFVGESPTERYRPDAQRVPESRPKVKLLACSKQLRQVTIEFQQRSRFIRYDIDALESNRTLGGVSDYPQISLPSFGHTPGFRTMRLRDNLLRIGNPGPDAVRLLRERRGIHPGGLSIRPRLVRLTGLNEGSDSGEDRRYRSGYAYPVADFHGVIILIPAR